MRIMSQVNSFLDQYKLFNEQFVFKKMNIYDYLYAEIEKISTLKGLHD